MKYLSTKTYGNELGLSCCFRQWKATHSHCQLLHGYAVGVHLEFGADELDERNWVYDFGGCKWIKEFLTEWFDHTTIIANDDPKKLLFVDLDRAGVLKLKILPAVGCEKFAQFIYEKISPTIETETSGRVKLLSVKVFEHAANSGSVAL